MVYYESEEQIEAVVKGFESCATPKEEFKHSSHLTVAVWYLSRFTQEEALQKIRFGLFRFLDHHGVGREKYNETLTIFWIKLVQNNLDQMGAETSLVEKVNRVLKRLGDPRAVFKHYSEESLQSAKAKQAWIEPDLDQVNG